MPQKGLENGNYFYEHNGVTYDVADTCLYYDSTDAITLSRFYYIDATGYKRHPAYTPYNSIDPWTIPAYVDGYPSCSWNLRDQFRGDPSIPNSSTNRDAGYAIVNGSKPQFYCSQAYQIDGSNPGSGNVNPNNQYWRLAPRADGSCLDLEYFGEYNSTPNYTNGERKISFSVDGKAPARVLVLIQAAGGGGGGGTWPKSGGKGNFFGPATGGGAGAFATVILNTTNIWYIRVGKAGWGGYGDDSRPSTYAYATCISTEKDAGDTGTGSYIWCGGGNQGQPVIKGMQADKAGGLGGEVHTHMKKSDDFWILYTENGGNGGKISYYAYRSPGSTSSLPDWYNIYPLDGDSVDNKYAYATNVATDQGKSGNYYFLYSTAGGLNGGNKASHWKDSDINVSGSGGASCHFGVGGLGGTACYASGRAASLHGAGGGGAGAGQKSGSSYQETSTDGGNGGAAFVLIYACSN